MTHPEPIDLSGAVKIGEGRFREVFRSGDKALKVVKPWMRKDYRWFHVNFPTNIYTRCKYGIPDFNEYELQTYREFSDGMHKDFKSFFNPVHRIGESEGRSVSVSDLVLNVDGSVALSLSKHGRVYDRPFWQYLEFLEMFLKDSEIPLLDIRGENIMVRETDDGMRPVMFDYKRFGMQTYQFQPWNKSDHDIEKKMERRFERLRKAHKR